MSKFIFIGCPYCSHALILGRFKKAAFPIDPLDFLILTRRAQKSEGGWPRGKGKGHRGFFNIPGEGKTIRELWNGSSEEKEIASAIARRIERIYNSYKKVGVIP
jgi:hypothetical protein